LGQLKKFIQVLGKIRNFL